MVPKIDKAKFVTNAVKMLKKNSFKFQEIDVCRARGTSFAKRQVRAARLLVVGP